MESIRLGVCSADCGRTPRRLAIADGGALSPVAATVSRWNDLDVADVIGSEKLAASAQPVLAQGERVIGAIPAIVSSPGLRVAARLVRPIEIYQLVKPPFRAIVATDRRVLVVRRSRFRRLVSGIASEHPASIRLDGEALPSGEYKVTALGKPLYVFSRHVGDLLRLNNQLSKR